MSSANPAEPRRYRFSPLVRTGLFGGMPTAQVAVLTVGCGLSFGGVLLRLFPWALLPGLMATIVAFKRAGSMSLYELIPLRLGWLRRRRRGQDRWFRPVPMLPAAGRRGAMELPAPMAGLRLLDVDAPWVLTPGRIAGVAVIHDSVASTLSASLRVCGDGQFSLCSAAEQDGRVAGWGDALAAFCRERRTVCRVAWQEWTTSSVLPATELAPVDGGAPGADYRTLIERAAPRATVHETLVTITVDLRAVTARRGKSTDTTAAGLQLLLDELRLFSQRLEAAGLGVDSPLSPAELAVVVRRRSNPFAERETATLGRSLASGLGVTTTTAAPMAYGEAWDHARVDGAVHRSWWIEGWPRLEVPAAWLDLVLLAGTATRTVTIVFHPISPSQAARAIDAAAVALESAESAKTKHGFRVRAKDRRARDEIDQREHELVAGHGDLEYVGFVDIAVPSTDGLDDASGELEQTVGHVGLQLRRLDGRHGLGWVTGLPLGR